MKADQIIAIESDLRADAVLRIWDVGGSEVTGSGTRAVARSLLDDSGKKESFKV